MMRTLAARKTLVEKVPKEIAFEFTRRNHRRGVPEKASGVRSYGLTMDGELVAVAIFCNARTRAMQRRYTTELLRLSFKAGIRVQGGASKLIRAFMNSGAPDLFTYQDLSGEATDVYAHSGMELISEQATKQILVIDGKTAETAEDNRKDWFSIEQASRHGVDRLLGVRLGEQFSKDGKRINNIELFKAQGYHLETVPGDRLYGWRNPAVSYYIYKIRSIEDSGYYIGRRILKKADPSLDDCLADKYMGSGGSRFKRWIETVGPDSLYKEIISIHSNWEDALKSEKREIGTLYESDPNCQNMQAGGLGWSTPGNWLQLVDCKLHGLTIHNGNACMKCVARKRYSQSICEIHGATNFESNKCIKCLQLKRYSEDQCPLHGKSVHRDGRCVSCINESTANLRHCAIHGYVKHQGSTCSSCNAQGSISERLCSKHGFTKHQGSVCSSCNAESVISLKLCPIHGETKHSGEHCMRCNAEAQFSRQTCAIHGEATFKGNSCTKCTVAKALSQKDCPIHGLTTHQGDVCNRCNAQKSISKRECPKHGLTTHQGSVCNRCNAESSVKEKECSVHGLSKFQGNQCVKCRNGSLISERECSVHGLSKHRGSSCMRCAQANRKKPEDALRERGLTVEDLRAAATSETIASIVRRFGISKHHVKRLISESR